MPACQHVVTSIAQKQSPLSGVGGWAPIPKKLRLEAVMMEVPMDMVYCTMIIGYGAGQDMLEQGCACRRLPMLRAACTNTLFFVSSVLPLTRRANLGILNTATAITTLYSPLPRMATMAIARISPGRPAARRRYA